MDITLSLVSHTNAGKTTLARTLLSRDIGEVRDAPHVTEFVSLHELIASPPGDTLRLADTPGFGDSAHLVRRLRQASQPLVALLAGAWDRWRDRPFWASQQALRHVQAQSDVVLYLVNAAESPQAAAWLAPEMELLAWVGRPVLVLLNQLGRPRAAAEEAADVQTWRDALAPWPQVRAVLPLDAFARCWVHEATLLATVQSVLTSERAAAMARLAAAWTAQREATFAAALQSLADSLARCAAAREMLDDDPGWSRRLGHLRRLGAALAQRGDSSPAAHAQARLVLAMQAEVRASTGRLLALHGLDGHAEDEILARVASQFTLRERVPEGRAAIVGGAVTGALTGLKADLLSGGLTLGGGLLVGGLLGALGAAGLARGINLVRGTGASWVAWSDGALDQAVEAALLRYLAVAHFGRGRGEWSAGEAPPHWAPAVQQALRAERAALAALWQSRGARLEAPDDAAATAATASLAAALHPVLERSARDVLRRLYPA
jgi:hypothetical protein